MLRGPELALLLLWATLHSAPSPGHACLCTALQPAGLLVNCTSSDLSELPPLPSDTRELHVQDNSLTSVPSGLFDKLLDLQSISLTGNPFHCDCTIEYLRNWLLRNRAAVSQEPTCFSPSSVAQKAITELTDDYFIQCAPRGCSKTTSVVVVMAVMLCCLIVLLLWSLRLAKDCTFTLNIEEKNLGLKVDTLYPLKVRHRRGLSVVNEHCHLFTEDLERHPVNMELLPQVLDVLHKKHNIKIKAI
ncbi:glycoprotein IX (platelet) isoform X2 [Phycodurus eques]|nr:glycoprotein IX (platelet) isoform X2 [Phycodurus eques]XP_061544916.1 glycoprotein IX (platelet) isoform X2 [Phycodurus eques]XP_061544924.1 glycoprotein IX (platelet) isoform X2 [Phycodurus eques]XP_061544934.1 glycoprotein IX (platelet) isoform X2 [Phycodurus eques]